MKPSEVRKGNLVEFEGRFFEIDTIADEFPTLNTTEFGIGVVSWENIKPIPLTPEWVGKLGFEHLGGTFKTWFIDYNVLPNLKRRIFIEGDKGFCAYLEGEGIVGGQSKFILMTFFSEVHQLQNLVFALTQTELTVKP